ncbi:hypothetical protein RYH80_19355 [Halobaculum sp. MBLA0147]|uniref:hypothetical protein n=1 Tax=Halobaculum sp. MBLA0147 TaxID=3079934 RepID=UPI003524D894
MTDRLLVYDAEPAWARRVASLVERTAVELELVPWQAPGVQALLNAQFDSQPFVFLVVDLECDTVYAGSETVGRLFRQWGVPTVVAELFENAYRTVANPVGRRLHGREPADLDGVFSLTKAARAHAESLHRTCQSPACTNRI